ncbi:MAG: CiaB protein, partial [Arcobacter sp.]
MTKEQFLNDLQKIYDFLNDQKTKTNELIKFLENKEFDKLTLIDDFAKSLNLEMKDDLRFALVTRLVNLRDDSLVQVLKKLEKNEKEIISLQEKAYQFVKEYWHDIHTKFIDFIVENKLLTPFYREV